MSESDLDIVIVADSEELLMREAKEQLGMANVSEVQLVTNILGDGEVERDGVPVFLNREAVDNMQAALAMKTLADAESGVRVENAGMMLFTEEEVLLGGEHQKVMVVHKYIGIPERMMSEQMLRAGFLGLASDYEVMDHGTPLVVRSGANVNFTPEASRFVSMFMDNDPDLVALQAGGKAVRSATLHTHPGMGIFLSGEDTQMIANFPDLAMVVDTERQLLGVFTAAGAAKAGDMLRSVRVSDMDRGGDLEVLEREGQALTNDQVENTVIRGDGVDLMRLNTRVYTFDREAVEVELVDGGDEVAVEGESDVEHLRPEVVHYIRMKEVSEERVLTEEQFGEVYAHLCQWEPSVYWSYLHVDVEMLGEIQIDGE